jgi:hypothetical protein
MGSVGEGPPTITGDQLTRMKGGLLLDVVVREGTTILKPLSSEDQAPLVGGIPSLS